MFFSQAVYHLFLHGVQDEAAYDERCRDLKDLLESQDVYDALVAVRSCFLEKVDPEGRRRTSSNRT